MTLLEIGAFATVFLLSLIISVAVMPLAIHLSHKWGIVSQPGGRRHETTRTDLFPPNTLARARGARARATNTTRTE